MNRLTFFLVVCATGCGVSTHVRPTPKGMLAAEASVGGPMVNAGAPVPLPLASVGASYGLSDRVDLHGHAHLTPLLAFKVAGADLGASWLALEQSGAKPAVTLAGRGYAFTDFASAVWPYAETTVTASWRVAERALPYATLSGAWSFVDRAFLWSPGVGSRFEFGRWDLQAEVRWYDPTYAPGQTVVPWFAPGGAGALGLVLGGSYRFDLRGSASPP